MLGAGCWMLRIIVIVIVIVTERHLALKYRNYFVKYLARIFPKPSTVLRNIGPGADLVREGGLPRSGCDDTSTSIARITTLSRGISQGRGQALHFGMAAKMQGMTPTVDPASPAHRLDARTSARSSFARHELGDVAFAR